MPAICSSLSSGRVFGAGGLLATFGFAGSGCTRSGGSVARACGSGAAEGRACGKACTASTSPALTEALGWVPAEWLGRSIAEFLHPDDREAHDRNARTLLSGKPVVARYRLRSRDSAYHWVETRAKPFRDETGAPDGVVASFRTIDLEVRAEEELERRARYDDLTGLLKRNEVLQRLSIPDGRRDPGADSMVRCRWRRVDSRV